MTAEDVVANLKWAQTAEAANNLLLNNMTAVSDIKAIDESTVEIAFNEPAAYFEAALGLQPVVEPSFLEKMQNEASGTGAFKVQEWVPGDHLTMVKNPDYWNAGRPMVDEAEVKIFADEGAMVSALEGGVIDIALSFPPREQERLKDQFGFLRGPEGRQFLLPRSQRQGAAVRQQDRSARPSPTPSIARPWSRTSCSASARRS